MDLSYSKPNSLIYTFAALSSNGRTVGFGPSNLSSSLSEAAHNGIYCQIVCPNCRQTIWQCSYIHILRTTAYQFCENCKVADNGEIPPHLPELQRAGLAAPHK